MIPAIFLTTIRPPGPPRDANGNIRIWWRSPNAAGYGEDWRRINEALEHVIRDLRIMAWETYDLEPSQAPATYEAGEVVEDYHRAVELAKYAVALVDEMHLALPLVTPPGAVEPFPSIPPLIREVDMLLVHPGLDLEASLANDQEEAQAVKTILECIQRVSRHARNHIIIRMAEPLRDAPWGGVGPLCVFPVRTPSAGMRWPVC